MQRAKYLVFVERFGTVSTQLLSGCELSHFGFCTQGVAGLHGSSGKLTGSTSSLNKLAVQGSSSRRSQSSSLLDMGNMSASDLDVADRTKFDKASDMAPVWCVCTHTRMHV